jgi:hypothetical protein
MTGGTLSQAAMLAALFVGVLFSSTLAIVYMPAVSILRRRASGNPALATQGFDKAPLQQFGRVLQALSPLIAAVPLSGLIALLE